MTERREIDDEDLSRKAFSQPARAQLHSPVLYLQGQS